MNILQELQNRAIEMASRSLKKGSRFYASDLDDIRANVKRKSVTELREMIGRFNALNNITQKEINTHCRFAGLS